MINILITGGNGNIAKMITKHFYKDYNIYAPSRNELNILNLFELEKYFENNTVDIIIHTAILGGRRNKEETGEITHINLIMLENILKFSNKVKMILNMDSGAIYDRKSDIYNRNENDLFTIPTDYYGFSKYMIYQRSLQYNNMYNLRIFNIYHPNEENDRFIKSCFIAKKNNTIITIFEDKYFDFFYYLDFLKIIEYYLINVNNNPIKTLNISYDIKYKLSDIAKIIGVKNINIVKENGNNNYCGSNILLQSLNLNISNLKDTLLDYEKCI